MYVNLRLMKFVGCKPKLDEVVEPAATSCRTTRKPFEAVLILREVCNQAGDQYIGSRFAQSASNCIGMDLS